MLKERLEGEQDESVGLEQAAVTAGKGEEGAGVRERLQRRRSGSTCK